MILMTFVGVTSAKSKQTKRVWKKYEKSLPIWTVPTPFRAHKTHSLSSPQCEPVYTERA